MKNTHIINFSIFMTFILTLIPYKSIIPQWSQNQFIIGTHWDPCLSSNTDTTKTTIVNQDIARFQVAKDAYFNLLTGTQNTDLDTAIVHSKAGMVYALTIASKVGLKYLVYDNRFNTCTYNATDAAAIMSDYTGLKQSLKDVLYGYNIWDEPNNSLAANVKLWINYFKTWDSLKLSYINLFPRYWSEASTNALYESYLDLYLNDSNSKNNPSVVSFDNYPFPSSGANQYYFYNLYTIREKAGSRPFWAWPMSTHENDENSFVDPNENSLRFMVFCPLAYGAKGLIYYTYERKNAAGYLDAIINDCDTKSTKYVTVKTINYFVTNIVAPVIMNSDNLGAFHKSSSSDPGGEILETKQLINPKTPLVSDLSNSNAMVGLFRSKTTSTTYYGLVINKSLTSISSLVVTLKGDLRNKISLSPSVVGYSGSTTYSSVTVNYNSTTNKSTFTISSLAGGEGIIFKAINVNNTYKFVSATDYDGDGSADISIKTYGETWKIDYASNGFNGWDVTYLLYGDSTAHPIPADYDGDGKADISVKTDGQSWLIDYASNGFGSWNVTYLQYGDLYAHPVPADYDGDGKADLSVKTDDGSWLIDYASNGFGSWNVTYTYYGGATWHPVPADYDGDGRADLSVKTDDGLWKIDYAYNGFGSFDSTFTGYGGATWHPVPADYDGDGKADLSVKIDNDGRWRIDYAYNGFGSFDSTFTFTNSVGDTCRPVPADYDGDGRSDLSVKTNAGRWLIDYASDGFGTWNSTLYGYGDRTSEPIYKESIKNITKQFSFNLSNYPNPFNPVTVIEYEIPNNDLVVLKIYDILGREVKTLLNDYRISGKYSISFDASKLASGIYFYQLKTGNFISTKKMLLIK